MIDVGTVENWLIQAICRIFGLDRNQVKGQTCFDDLGMDSITRTGLASEIEKRFGLKLDPEELYEFPTIRCLAEHVSGI